MNENIYEQKKTDERKKKHNEQMNETKCVKETNNIWTKKQMNERKPLQKTNESKYI